MTILPMAWAGIIAFCVLMYVILDGFTLGTGMVMPFLKTEERSIAMSVILPNWDGNQTWLVLGMASLYGAFPLAFSTLLPILYVPLILMVIALLFRGVVFEFRLKSHHGRHRWDFLFCLASVLAAFIQGSILGNVIHGFDGAYEWLNPFSVLTGITVVVGYALLGTTRLILKTSGDIQSKMRRNSISLALLFVILLVGVSFASLYAHPVVHDIWFNLPHKSWIALFPIIAAIAFVILFFSLMRTGERVPYWATVVIFLCCFAGFGLDIFPYIVPYHITIEQAASSYSSLIFIMVGAVIMLPVLLIYTGYSYHIFRGKTEKEIEY